MCDEVQEKGNLTFIRTNNWLRIHQTYPQHMKPEEDNTQQCTVSWTVDMLHKFCAPSP